MLSCFVFFECCDTRDVVMLCFLFKSETPDECCDTSTVPPFFVSSLGSKPIPSWLLLCFVFFEYCDTRRCHALCLTPVPPHTRCVTPHTRCAPLHTQAKKRLRLTTRLQATSFTPASEKVEGVLASPRKTLLKASHLDLGQALCLDLRHIRLVVELAAI